jgi:glycosyltransferase involved in cell wall biosynthesis
MSAYAFHKPVIATNVGGLPEMVLHQKFGLVVKEKDSQALTNAIVELWQMPDRLNEFAKQIEEAYDGGDLSWQQVAQELCSEYQKHSKAR